MERNRWGIAASAVGIHICIGSVYAWSVLTKPVMQTLGAGMREVQWTFSLAILFLGLSAAFFGPVVERYGPRVSGLMSTICFALGMFGTAFAVDAGSLMGVYLAYGCIGGIGLGVGYITPVATLIKWFPDKQGFATGLAIMGFGFASLIAGPVMQALYAAYGLMMTFVILGTVYALVMTASSLYLKPPEDFKFTLPKTDSAPPPVRSYTAKEALRTPAFYIIWWIFFTNITCGIGILSIASPMASEMIGLSAGQAATFVGTLGLVNGLGRIVWASVSDYIGRVPSYILFFLLQVIAYAVLADTVTAFIFYLLIAIVISCYGGGFAVLPATLAERYGTRSLSNIHGKTLTAWSAAGIVGPVLVSVVRTHTDGFAGALYIFTAMCALALALSIFLHFMPRQPQTFGQVKHNGG